MARTGLSPKEISNASLEYATIRIKRDGFKKLRFADIARDLGISHTALYAHFTNKNALVDKLIASHLTKIETTLRKICDQNTYPIKAIYKWLLCHYQLKHDMLNNEPKLFECYVDAVINTKPYVNVHLVELHDQLAILVTKAIDLGLFKSQSAVNGAKLLLVATNAFHHPCILTISPYKDNSLLLVSLIDILVAGLRE